MGKIQITHGTDNIFFDLGHERAEAEVLLLKADLAIFVQKIIKQRKLTQLQAGKILGIDQPRVSKLINGQMSIFSTDSLLSFVLRLSYDLDVLISPAPKKRGYSQVMTVEPPKSAKIKKLLISA